MDYLAKYTVSFKGLKDGIHEFEFTVDEKFFNHFEITRKYKGEIAVKIILGKKPSILSLKVTLKGAVNAMCDRCLDYFDMPVKGESVLYVKFGSSREKLAEDIIVIPEEEHEIKLAQHIYELVSLSMPLKIIHPDNEDGKSTCNKTMIRKIKELSVNKNKEADPRWDALKKLHKN